MQNFPLNLFTISTNPETHIITGKSQCCLDPKGVVVRDGIVKNNTARTNSIQIWHIIKTFNQSEY